MTKGSILEQNTLDLEKALSLIDKSWSKQLAKLGHEVAQHLKLGAGIYWCGNGGSAAESQHMAAELMGRFLINRSPIKSISLTTDTSVLTCISNDYNFSDIFSRQIEGIAAKGDFLVLFSTSGNSENQIRAAKKAIELGVTTISFLGSGGGELGKICDFNFTVNSSITARIQEVHTLLGHTFCEIIEQEYVNVRKD